MVYIRNLSGYRTKAFVTRLSHNSGNDAWSVLPASFDERSSRWNRSHHGWELISFEGAADPGNRVGFYLELRNATTYVTFNALHNVDIQAVYE
ncbi:hypothetical protein E1B28_003743 [Marasmius oreades]|nr:uncharacterized protein E1B28_003743 [Marasmius oreades]KAG7096297.1 hypothetical protein E1B28_003743 [Marasmius oreades]